MKIIVVISPKVPRNLKELIELDDKIVYAVDSAVKELIKQNIKIDLAIGDFDSLKETEYLNNLKTIKLSKYKDDSDTAYALRHAYQQTDEVILIGGLHSKRVDHLIANIMLLEKYPNLVIMNENNLIRRLEVGEYSISKSKYRYLSVFPVTNVKINIKNTLYVLNNQELSRFDTLGLSNEIINKMAIIEVLKGVLLVIQTK